MFSFTLRDRAFVSSTLGAVLVGLIGVAPTAPAKAENASPPDFSSNQTGWISINGDLVEVPGTGPSIVGSDPAHPLPAPAFVPPPFSTAPTDAAEPAGDAYVRQVQEYLKQLGFYHGEPDGVLDWATVEALVKFDASGAGPTAVIADPKHLDEVWIARLKTALATKGAPPGADTPP